MSFTVPKVTCARSGAGGISLGVATADLGGNSVEAVIAVGCRTSTAPPTYEAEAAVRCSGIPGTYPMFAVRPGHRINVTSVSQKKNTTATVWDVTTVHGSTKQSCPTRMNAAIYGMFCPIGWTGQATGSPSCGLVPKFADVEFTNASLNGRPLDSFAPTTYTLNAATEQITPSHLNPTGDDFTDTDNS